MATILPIVGTQFCGGNVEMLLGLISVGTRMVLRPEPGNRFDPNAKMVVLYGRDITQSTKDAMPLSLMDSLRNELKTEIHLGYIPAVAAAHPKIAAIQSEIPVRFRISPTGKPEVEFEKPDQN